MDIFKRILFILFFAAVIAAAIYLMRLYFTPRPDPAPMESSSFGETQTALTLKFDDASVINEMGEREFKGHSKFEIVDHDGQKVLKVSSQGTSSVRYKQIDMDMARHPFLTWDWKVEQFPTGKKNEVLGAKTDNDYGARVYAIFKGDFPFHQYIIQYLWDDHFPEGEVADSPFLKSVKMKVVQSGPSLQEGWVTEKRDLYQDYEKLFGKKPDKNLVVIGLTSDSDNTGTQSAAYFKEISIETTADAPETVPEAHPSNENILKKGTRFIGDRLNDLRGFFRLR